RAAARADRGRRALLAQMASARRLSAVGRRGLPPVAGDGRALRVGRRRGRLADRVLAGRLGPLRVAAVADARRVARCESRRPTDGGVPGARAALARPVPALDARPPRLGDLRLPGAVISPARRAAFDTVLRVV